MHDVKLVRFLLTQLRSQDPIDPLKALTTNPICMSVNVIYCLTYTLCKGIYIGATGRRLVDRFREHLWDVEKKNDTDASKLVVRHFNLPSHSHHNIAICRLSLHHANMESGKNLKQKVEIHLLAGYALSTRDQWIPLIPLINSQSHVTIIISTNDKAPRHSLINLTLTLHNSSIHSDEGRILVHLFYRWGCSTNLTLKRSTNLHFLGLDEAKQNWSKCSIRTALHFQSQRFHSFVSQQNKWCWADQNRCSGIGPSIKGTPSGGLYTKQPKQTLGQKTALTPRARNCRRNPQRIPKLVLQTWPKGPIHKWWLFYFCSVIVQISLPGLTVEQEFSMRLGRLICTRKKE